MDTMLFLLIFGAVALVVGLVVWLSPQRLRQQLGGSADGGFSADFSAWGDSSSDCSSSDGGGCDGGGGGE
ncbi:hypothetical protein [Deinococcus roseus]|uniref:Methanol dehydrogenase n=1 Tax=Deinococcus roseus TaxID=392414 RepID=A0ABQ2CZV9_9DEIO|nr:hypothetical protein [Deinococcus roseus]GGJ37482.1 hypothetical protein GCM10008938_24520 [Deinococcus roseus]